jgi:hypothetical protein
MTNTKTLRSRMKGKLSCPVLKTSRWSDLPAEFNYAAIACTKLLILLVGWEHSRLAL